MWFQTILLVSSQVKLASIIRRIVWFVASLALSVRADTGARSEASKSQGDCFYRLVGLPSGMCRWPARHDLRCVVELDMILRFDPSRNTDQGV